MGSLSSLYTQGGRGWVLRASRCPGTAPASGWAQRHLQGSPHSPLCGCPETTSAAGGGRPGWGTEVLVSPGSAVALAWTALPSRSTSTSRELWCARHASSPAADRGVLPGGPPSQPSHLGGLLAIVTSRARARGAAAFLGGGGPAARPEAGTLSTRRLLHLEATIPRGSHMLSPPHPFHTPKTELVLQDMVRWWLSDRTGSFPSGWAVATAVQGYTRPASLWGPEASSVTLLHPRPLHTPSWGPRQAPGRPCSQSRSRAPGTGWL